jgi:hypothetical protein
MGKDARGAARAQRRGDEIVAVQCKECSVWFTTRLRSLLCLRCEVRERRPKPSGQLMGKKRAGMGF